MTREEKNQIIDNLVEKIKDSNVIYLTDISTLNAQNVERNLPIEQACLVLLKIAQNAVAE